MILEVFWNTVKVEPLITIFSLSGKYAKPKKLQKKGRTCLATYLYLTYLESKSEFFFFVHIFE